MQRPALSTRFLQVLGPRYRPHRMAAFLAIFSGMLIAAAVAHAADRDHDPVPTEVRGVKLASICGACGVVSDIRTETRESKNNAAGTVAGALIGGLAGHAIGGGSGRTVGTVVGAVGGGVAGNQIEKKMNKVTVWITTVTFKDGSVGSYERSVDSGLAPGDVVTINDGYPVRRAR